MCVLLAGLGFVQAQTTITFTNAGKYWGNSTNWNPNTIPNAVDVVAQVNIASANINLTNTAENNAASGAFPFAAGKLQIGSSASGTIGVSAGSADERLRLAVSTGVPVIDYSAGVSVYCKLYGNQGLYITNSAQNNKLLEFRYNTSTMQLTGMVEIATGACLEQNGDYTLGNPTNILQLDDGATWSTRTSLNTAGDTTPATRPILLNSPNTPANIGTYSSYPWRIFAPIGEIAAGSSLKMPGTIAGSTTYGAGVITMTATNTFTGPMIVAGGTLNCSNQYVLKNNTLTMSGGSVTFDKGITGNAFNIGGLAGNGNLAVQNTTPAAIVLTLGGNNANTIYSGNLTGAGTMVKVGSGTLDIQGAGNNTAGLLTVSNGTVILDKTSSGTVHAINNGLAISGGTAQLSGSGGDQIANANIVTLNSGTFDLNNQAETIGGLAGSGGTIADSMLGSTATLTVSVASGSVTNSSAITGGNLTFGGAGTQVFAGADNRDAYVLGLTSTVNNGTLQIGTSGALVAFGGATGITVTSPGTLALNGTGTFTNGISGTGNFAVNSPGTVTYTGNATHTGKTLVNSGTLALGTGATSLGGTTVTIASNATLNVTGGGGSFAVASGQTLNGYGTVTGNFSLAGGAVLNPGASLTAGTLTVTGNLTLSSGSQSFVYDLSTASTPGGGTNALLVVSGNLNFGSATPVLTINGTPAAGTYTLATFGSFTGSASQLQVPTGGSLTYTPVINGTKLQLIVTGSAQNQVWRGDGTANVWDANDSGNPVWFNTGSSTLDSFGTGDNVLFNDSSTNPVVTLTGTLQPSSLLVNATTNYTFTGVGAIDGTVGLVKTNSGTLTIQNNNTFSGAVNLNGGIISVATVAAAGTAQPLGEGSTLAFNGGTLQYSGTGGYVGQAASVGANGATVDQSGSGILYITNALTGSGALTKKGTSQLLLSANNTGYTGTTYVQNGQLQLDNANGLGNGGSMVYATNSGASLAVGGGVTGTIVKPITLTGDGGGNGALQAFSAATFSGAIALPVSASIGGTASNTISGIISGPGMLTVLGSGTQALTATNTYTGGTTISSGTLQLGNGGTSGWIGPVPAGWSSITNNGCLQFNHSDNVALTNSITGGTNGWINQIGTGTLTLGAANNFAGGVALAHPTIGLTFTAALQALGPVLVTNSLALGTVGAETGASANSHLRFAGNISVPAPISVWSTASGVVDVENVNGTNSVDQILGIYGSSYWPITSTAGNLNINIFSNVIYNSTYTRVLQLQGAANGSLTNTIDPSYYWLQIEKDGAGTWSLEGSIDAPIGLVVNSGTLILDGNVNALLRNQTISHTVAGGALVVNGSLPVGSTSGNVAVNGGQIGGIGYIGGNVTVGTGGTLAPGAGTGTNTASLTVSGNLILGGKSLFNLNKSLAQSNDFVTVAGTLTNSTAATLTVTNYGANLLTNDTFVLFSQPMLQGANLTIVGGAPAGKIITWTNNLAVDGSIRVLSIADAVNTNTFSIGSSVSGGNLNLTWPPDRLGWKLWVQTNSLSTGLGTNWSLWPNSATVTNVSIPIVSTNPTVFFRMTYP